MSKTLTQKPEKPGFQRKVTQLPSRQRKNVPIPGTGGFEENYSHDVPADQAGMIRKRRKT